MFFVFVCIYPAHLHWRLGPFKTNTPGNTRHRSQGKEAFHSNGFEGMFRPRGSVESLKSPAGLLAERVNFWFTLVILEVSFAP